jgi:hypothetical protein
MLLVLALALGACSQPAGTGPSWTPSYHVQVDEDPGPLHSAQRHSYCIRVQCAYTSADYRSSCVKACTDSWSLARPHPVVVVKPPAPRGGGVVVAPIHRPLYHFDSNHAGTGVIAVIRLPFGRHVFRATHTGSSNFIVYLNVPGGGPEVAFNNIGPGHWRWDYQVQTLGDYSIDIKAADGEWSIDID